MKLFPVWSLSKVLLMYYVSDVLQCGSIVTSWKKTFYFFTESLWTQNTGVSKAFCSELLLRTLVFWVLARCSLVVTSWLNMATHSLKSPAVRASNISCIVFFSSNCETNK